MFRRPSQRKQLLTAGLLLVWAGHFVAGQQNNPTDSIRLSRFEKSIEQGKIDEVEKLLLDYAVTHPGDVRALDLLGRVRYRQGRFEEAKSLYRRALTLDPGLVRVKIELGRVTYESGQHEDARRLLNEVTQTPAADPAVQLSLAQTLLLVGEFQKALTETDKLPGQLKNTEALPIIAASHLALGDRKGLAALLPSMKKAAAASKPAVAVQCAEVLHAAGMVEQSVGLLRLALVAAPGSIGVLVLLGRLEIETQDFVQARRHLNHAATLDPRSASALSSLALLESAQGNLSAAMSLLERARSLAPDSPPVLSQYVLTAIRANRPREAADAANMLLESRPDEPEFLYLFGAASLQNGSLDSAQSALERYVQQRPDDPRGCLALGIAYSRRRDQPEAAKAQFERCLQIDPAHVEAKYQLGSLFKAQGEMTKAIHLLEEATARSPRHVNALRDLGTLYLQSGDEAKARVSLERAVALNPQDEEIHFQLSRLYNRVGESGLARRHLELFQKLKSQRERTAVQ